MDGNPSGSSLHDLWRFRNIIYHENWYSDTDY